MENSLEINIILHETLKCAPPAKFQFACNTLIFFSPARSASVPVLPSSPIRLV